MPPRPTGKRLLLVLLAATFALDVACSGGHSQAPPPAGYTGEFDLERFLTYSSGASPAPYLYANADFLGGGHYLDAGDGMVLHGSAGNINLVRNVVLSEILYQKAVGTILPLSLYVPASDYSAQGAGSSQDLGVPAFDISPVLHTPPSFSLSKPDLTTGALTITASSNLNLSWVPGNPPASYVAVILIIVSGGTPTEISFELMDNGTGLIPASKIALLPPGRGTITVERVLNSTFPLPEGGTGTGVAADAVACSKLTRQ